MARGLFDPDEAELRRTAPLAERMRPRTLEEIVGQRALEHGSPLSLLLRAGRTPSLLFWGPPGSGKTTTARLVAGVVKREFRALSAVTAGVKEVRAAIEDARALRSEGRGVFLFVDEIHHFNRSQQDALLPHVEDGTVVFGGATTENPSFHVNAALLSRCTVVELEPLGEDALGTIARRALEDRERGLGSSGVALDAEALALLVQTSHGDARSLLNRLEALTEAARAGSGGRPVQVDRDAAARLLATKRPAYDKSGDRHYDYVSALHKSIRGGDPQAALYYLARMLDGGEAPLYVGRRLVRIATEDVGLADPRALRVALDAVETFRFLGSPEGELALAEAAVYLATAPKSNAVYAAFGAVKAEIAAGAVHEPPPYLKNAPTKLMAQLGRGRGYLYPHDFADGAVDQDYLPPPLRGRTWYEPSPYGEEKEIARRMRWWDEVRAGLRRESAPDSPTGESR
jgi:putative ATPase